MTSPRELSLGEIEALVTKAARGAGYPWGLAAEAGAATRRLVAAGAPGAALFAAFLTEAAARPFGEDCPLRNGLHDADTGRPPPGSGRWAEIRAAAAGAGDPASNQVASRCVASETTLAALEALAARTYAPATEESRARGAG